jgi:hypothetical protein
MADIAELGISIKVNGADATLQQLKNINAEAGKLDTTANNVSRNGVPRLSNVLSQNTQAVGLNANAWRNLSYQVNDVVTGLASGQSPFMILTQQGGQVYQVLAGAGGGVTGALKSIGGYLSSILTVGRLAFGGTAAAAGSALVALKDYEDRQSAILVSLQGIGRASGVTLQQINQIGTASASAFGLSTREATSFASTLAATGKIGADTIGQATKLGHDLAIVLGTDAKDAALTLAQALAFQGKTLDDLNAHLGAFSAATVKQINDLVQQNRLGEAQKIIIQGVASATQNASDVTTTWSKAWTALGNAASNAWSALGRGIDNTVGFNKTLQQQLDDAKAQVDALSKRSVTILGVNFKIPVTPEDLANLDKAKQKVAELSQKVEDASKAAADTKANLQSLTLRPIVMSVLPEIDAKQALLNAQQSIGGLTEDPVLMKALGLTQEQANRAKGIIDDLVGHFKTSFEAVSTNLAIANKGITAFSPAAKAVVAQLEMMESLRDQKMAPEEKAALGAMAYANALKQATTALSEQNRVRQLTATQAVASAQLDISLIGKSVGEQATLTANLQARQQLEQQASQNRTAFDQKAYDALVAQNDQFGKLKQAYAEQQAVAKATFDLQTAGLSGVELEIAQLNQQLHGDHWKEFGDSGVAGLVRVADALPPVEEEDEPAEEQREAA